MICGLLGADEVPRNPVHNKAIDQPRTWLFYWRLRAIFNLCSGYCSANASMTEQHTELLEATQEP
jgi:hypothetical protein